MDNPLIALGLVLNTLSRMIGTTAFSTCYTFTAELYPTQVRGNAVGAGSMASRVGGMCVPIILSWGAYQTWIPGMVVGSLGVLAGVLVLNLPETRGVGMLGDFESAREFYQSAS